MAPEKGSLLARAREKTARRDANAELMGDALHRPQLLIDHPIDLLADEKEAGACGPPLHHSPRQRASDSLGVPLPVVGNSGNGWHSPVARVTPEDVWPPCRLRFATCAFDSAHASRCD